ncbi:MAG: Maf family protein [Treponema sp.]|nr:Maf family protein [Treponema sp.]MCL2251219.1 Maf family protein [Treponema sp.]
MESIILASGSLRRQEYFKLMGLPFSILKADVDESLVQQTNPKKLTVELAVKKVERAIEMMSGRLPKWICAGDTVISLDDKIFGKPADREEAALMLKELSGKQHKVVSSIALYNGSTKKIDTTSASCTVTFAALTDEEIEWYLNTNEWQGVAGAYRIQELASIFITQIKGSPSTVAGLPLREFYVMLKDNGYPYAINES